VTSATQAALAAEAGQLVFFSGAGTGKPPLAFTWQMSPVGGASFASVPGASIWWNTVGVDPGVYTVSLQVQNSAGTATSLPLSIILTPAPPLDFYTVAPCRVYDTRWGVGAALLSGAARIIQVAGFCDIPLGARAVAANVTAISPTGTGNVSLYPGNYPQPVSSTVNFQAGITRSNYAILPLATNGAGTLASLPFIAGSGSTEIAIDVSGYFLP
jgi:PKD repeat protein